MELKLENVNTTPSSKKPTDRDKARKKMLVIFGGIASAVALILIVLFIISLVVGKKYTYVEIEGIMKDAAVSYYKDYKGRLPSSESIVEAVDTDILSRNEYMKPLNEYLKEGVNCTGKVEVDYNNGKYLYTPYLECGKAYSTTELHKKVVDNNVVVSGYGIYNINGDFVYRGETANNYIKLDEEGSLFRIVKFTSTGEAVLIKDELVSMSSVWDNRYNASLKYNSGINDFPVSRIQENLNNYLKPKKSRDKIFTEAEKEKFISFDLCIGKRTKNHAFNDNSAECSVTEKNQSIGLLTLSDYSMASTDPNCTGTLNKACQNYNYLKPPSNILLVTSVADNNYEVYRISQSGYPEVTNASSSGFIRPVVHISAKTMYKSGKGTINNPYRIR